MRQNKKAQEKNNNNNNHNMIPTLCTHTHTLAYKSTQTKNLTNYVYQESKDNKTYI